MTDCICSREVVVGNTITLIMEITGNCGEAIDADSSPTVEIIDCRGFVRRAASSSGVVRTSTGKYELSFVVVTGSSTGIWTDHWEACINGVQIEARLYFVVLSSNAEIGECGAQIGDDPCITYTADEIYGINVLMAQLKARLDNDLRSESVDAYGNTIFTDCPVFSDIELTWFLVSSLSQFNQEPHFTSFLFSDQVIYERYAYVIVEGAFIVALTARILLEAGREFSITDNGVVFNPSQISSMMNNELSLFVTSHRDMLKRIKWSIKPSPRGFGSFRVTAVNPAYMRLRHLRQRQII